MKTKVIVAVGLAGAALIAVGLWFNHQPAGEVELVQPQQSAAPSSSTNPAEAPAPAATSLDETSAPVEVAAATVQHVEHPKEKKAAAGKPARTPEPAQNPTARAALSFVGMDHEAEAYWMDAINDPNLPAEERKNLIEDLNEDGLSDPHHPGPQDMPLILSRIQLIEQLGPSAMDQVNADAFAEAYKDLVNLASGRALQ